VSEETVNAWSQRKEEGGRLPLGKILAVEEFRVQRDRPFNSGAYAAAVPYVGGLAAAGAMLVGRAATSTDTAYRHAIRMKTGELYVFELEFAYKVGECIAFRQGLSSESVQDMWPVRALPGECERV
jgi:hypothetical protein